MYLKLGDKILTALGFIVTVAGIATTFATGFGATGIASIATGVGMIAKGCEEFYNGDTTQAVSDIVQGTDQVKAAAPKAAKEVEKSVQ